jgi:hypothetical protein
MLSMILGLIPGAFSTINGITSAISNQKIAAIKAKTEEERIHAEENVKVLQARRDVLLSAQAKSKFSVWVQNGFGVIALVILAKIGIWDKVIGSAVGCAGELGKLPGCETFTTDKLGTDLSLLLSASIAFYLVTSSRLFNK